MSHSVDVAPTSLEAVRRSIDLDYAAVAEHIGGACTAEDAERFLLGLALPSEGLRQRIEVAFGFRLQMDLATWRRAAGLSLDEVAELVDYPAETLGRLERGEWFGAEVTELLSRLAMVSDDTICPIACYQIRIRHLQALGPVVIPDIKLH